MTIDEVNALYAIIGIGNRMMVMEQAPDGSIAEFWDYEHFKKRLCKEYIRVEQADGKIKSMPLADVWLRHRRGRSYNKLVYDMPGSIEQAGPRDYNGWQGFTTLPKVGDWSLNRQHLRDVICGGDEEACFWVMNWLAALIQFPGRHAWTAIVLRGGQGIGKGHFADKMVGKLFGPQQYIHVLGAGQLTSDFNEHISGKVLIFADESTWGGDPRAASILKGMVTEDQITINRKFLKMVAEPSKLHIIIASNNAWPIPIETGDRRFTVLDVSDEMKQNQAYFGALIHELNHGGRAAFLADLLAWQIDDVMLRTPLMTAAKAAVATETMKPIERWWLEMLNRGTILDDVWPDRLLKKELHHSYLTFLDQHYKASRERRATETELGTFLQKFTPAQQRMTVNGKVERVVWIPALDECRAAWIQAVGWRRNHSWDGTETPVQDEPWALQPPHGDPDEM